VGAGRKPDPDSIRQSFAEARAKNYNHSYTKWEVERDSYVSKHGTWLLFHLAFWRNKKTGRPFLTPHAAYRIAHFPKSRQAFWLSASHGDKLLAAYEQYKDSKDKHGAAFATASHYVFEHQEMPKKKK
jgi:hypothetical protein